MLIDARLYLNSKSFRIKIDNKYFIVNKSDKIIDIFDFNKQNDIIIKFNKDDLDNIVKLFKFNDNVIIITNNDELKLYDCRFNVISNTDLKIYYDMSIIINNIRKEKLRKLLYINE